MGAAALAKQSDAIVALAAEGALVAQDGVDGKTTAIFTREHSAGLAKAAAITASSLGKAQTRPPLERPLRRLRVLAARVRDQLERLGGASQEEQRSIARALERAAAEATKISAGLA